MIVMAICKINDKRDAEMLKHADAGGKPVRSKMSMMKSTLHHKGQDRSKGRCSEKHPMHMIDSRPRALASALHPGCCMDPIQRRQIVLSAHLHQ
jgi:hypothetical protein